MLFFKNKKWNVSVFWFCAMLYWELLSHAGMFGEFQLNFLFAVGFSGAMALVIAFVLSFLPKKGILPVSLILCIAAIVLYGSQMVYCFIFGTPYSVGQIGLGADAISHFWREMFSGMAERILWLLGLLVPPATLVFMHRMEAFEKADWVRRVVVLLLAAALGVAAYAGLCSGGKGMYSNYYFFANSASTTSQTMERYGVPTTFLLELFRPEAEDDLIIPDFVFPDASFLNPLSEPEMAAKSPPNKKLSKESTFGSTEDAPEYNILDIDFDALMQSTDSSKVAALHNYFSNVPGTRKNEYTGRFSDYNLIVICAESFSTAALDPEITPTLYRMAHEGFIFNNYFNSFPNTTVNGEYALLQGLFPDPGRDKFSSSMRASYKNYLPFTLGNAFSQQRGVTSRGYHNYTGDYYSRNLTHPNMGYVMSFNHDGMELSRTWPNSDLEMMQQSVDDYIHDPQFHAYYMTFSGHYHYSPSDNAIAAQNYDQVRDIPGYNITQKSYLACHIELDRALEYLLQRLEEEGIADKTAIVLASDHFPYGLQEDEYFQMIAQPKSKFEQYRSTLIFWVGGMEPVEVDTYCCNVDILPTLLNLWGFDYDSRLLSGTDIFSDSLHAAVLIDRSFLTNVAWFNSNKNLTQYLIDEDSVPNGYVNYMNQLIATRFELAKQIVAYDYFNLVLGSGS